MVTAKTPASADRRCRWTSSSPSNGRTGVLTGGFRYEPAAPNTAPVIRSIDRAGQAPQAAPVVCRLWRNHSNHARRRGRGVGGNTAGIPMAAGVRRNVRRNRARSRLDRATARDVALNVHDPGDGYSMGRMSSTRSIAVRLHNSVEEVRNLVVGVPRGVRQLD